jgi:YD repeat-containing protein
LEADINTLLAYPEFARPPILEGAIGYANVILDKIYEIGKCDCPGDGTEVPVVCNTSLQQVCWLSVEKFEYNQTIPGLPALEQEQQDMEEAVQYTAQPIWRPNSTFYVHYQLKDEVDNGAGGDTFDYYYGFKTAGPIGHFHNADGVTYGNEYDENDNLINRVDSNGNPSAAGKLTNPDKYPLTSLRQYIDYDKSYPNADGNLLQAKPVFYGQEQCRITLYFTKPLAYHMLRSWESYLGSDSLTGAMHIAIKDPVSDVTIPYPLPIDYNEDSVPLPEGNGEGGVPWIDDNDPRIPLNIRLLNNFINYINENNDAIECTFTVGNAIQPQSYAYSVTLTNLKPQKLYTALIYNAFETESNDVVSSAQVHNYVFQTSRYQNFEAQVNSYLLVDEDDTNNTRQAVFNVALPNLTPSDIDTAYNIVDGNPDANSDVLETQYLDVFDRLLEGVLGMQPLDPAVNTEFNKILDGDGNIIAILIRNPEPFNIPKIPIAQINGTEEIFEAGSTVGHRGAIRVFDKVTDVDDDAYKVLYSKDYSQAIIMHESKQITADTLSFKFRYLIWDVNTYVIDDTARAEDIVLAQ